MAQLQEFPLVTRDGLSGSVFRAARFLDRAQQNRVRLDDGREFDVPSTSLQVQADGSFLLDEDLRPLDSSSSAINGGSSEEEAAAEPEPLMHPIPSRDQGGEPLFSDEVSVERVTVNRIVDTAPDVRQEGETTVIPVVEEVLTIQKRLMLKEEVRITRKRTPIREPRRIVIEGSGGGFEPQA